MRDIIFRGKALNYNEWIYGCFYWEYREDTRWGCISLRDNRKIYIKENTISQYTGIKDKLGTKIFEGDVIEYKLNGKSDRIGYVVYKDCQFYVKDKIGEGYRLVDLDKGYSIEVVGNIYDDKELLK